jgi:hypothetical protein
MEYFKSFICVSLIAAIVFAALGHTLESITLALGSTAAMIAHGFFDHFHEIKAYKAELEKLRREVEEIAQAKVELGKILQAIDRIQVLENRMDGITAKERFTEGRSAAFM